MERYDADLIAQATAELMDYSERRLRAEIRELPDGEYSASMLVEDDGVTADPFEVKVTIVIEGDQIIADFTGTSPQVRGPMNCTVVVVASAIYNAVFSVTDPHSTIPRNSGCYRPIKFIAPAGSVVNVVHPGPCVGGNTDLQPKLIDLLLKAFSHAVPERVAAASGGSSSNFLFGGIHPVTGTYYTNYHFDGHGTGGTVQKDGNNGEITRHSNCRNTPVEVFEGRYPFRNLEYRLMPDSGGPGEHRGGLSTTRTLEVTADEITLSCLFDRAKIPGWGLFDGKSGGLSQFLVKRVGDDSSAPSSRRSTRSRRRSSPTSSSSAATSSATSPPAEAVTVIRTDVPPRTFSRRPQWLGLLEAATRVRGDRHDPRRDFASMKRPPPRCAMHARKLPRWSIR